ncbi:hypothetical protein BV898_07053 [Hypsibius exemplaris]|uniref:Uncharacterized protein n=1 Tax=Hypsibius exemplaris TaxID=2072580 RepID=A0A1W0WUV7_HYPEX|nr:hypothetical protein BV898_07053 [Hypsibius exemplaris]
MADHLPQPPLFNAAASRPENNRPTPVEYRRSPLTTVGKETVPELGKRLGLQAGTLKELKQNGFTYAEELNVLLPSERRNGGHSTQGQGDPPKPPVSTSGCQRPTDRSKERRGL